MFGGGSSSSVELLSRLGPVGTFAHTQKSLHRWLLGGAPHVVIETKTETEMTTVSCVGQGTAGRPPSPPSVPSICPPPKQGVVGVNEIERNPCSLSHLSNGYYCLQRARQKKGKQNNQPQGSSSGAPSFLELFVLGCPFASQLSHCLTAFHERKLSRNKAMILFRNGRRLSSSKSTIHTASKRNSKKRSS